MYITVRNRKKSKQGRPSDCKHFYLENGCQLCYFYQKKMSPLVQEFSDYRTKMNEIILSKNNLVMKRLWTLDTNTYEQGDCIKYHLGKAYEQGVTTTELYEIFAVANIVGGTIVVPHTRRAAEYWEALQD
jgi:alkylhydroperoxidase/carboxymuconolactone decarboxylase family protein YurZ